MAKAAKLHLQSEEEEQATGGLKVQGAKTSGHKDNLPWVENRSRSAESEEMPARHRRRNSSDESEAGEGRLYLRNRPTHQGMADTQPLEPGASAVDEEHRDCGKSPVENQPHCHSVDSQHNRLHTCQGPFHRSRYPYSPAPLEVGEAKRRTEVVAEFVAGVAKLVGAAAVAARPKAPYTPGM